MARHDKPRAAPPSLPTGELPKLASDLLGALAIGGQVEQVGVHGGKGEETPVYQLQAGAIAWTLGHGRIEADPIRVARPTAAIPA